MDKTLAWLWLADAVGSGCQYAQELLTLYPDPAELYDALRAGTEAPPACLTPHALAQLRDTTPFDYEERLDHCLLSGIDVLTPDEGVYPDRLRDLPDLPLALYVTGDIACLNGRRYAGMVGTRRPSTYGRQAAFDLSLAMARGTLQPRQWFAPSITCSAMFYSFISHRFCALKTQQCCITRIFYPYRIILPPA